MPSAHPQDEYSGIVTCKTTEYTAYVGSNL